MGLNLKEKLSILVIPVLLLLQVFFLWNANSRDSDLEIRTDKVHFGFGYTIITTCDFQHISDSNPHKIKTEKPNISIVSFIFR